MIKKIFHICLAGVLLASAMLFFTSGTAHAYQSGTDGFVQGPVNDDVFVIAKSVTITGEINGSVIVVGSTINVDAQINGDVLLAGGKVNISGGTKITGNLYLVSSDSQIMGEVQGSFASASLSLVISNNAIIHRNAYLTGYSAELGANAQVMQNFYAADFQTTINGTIQQNAGISAGAIEVYGRIFGNAQFKVSAPGEPTFYLSLFPGVPMALESGLRVYPSAKIAGNLQYTSTVNQNENIHIQNTPIFRTPIPDEPDKQANNAKPSRPTTSTFVMTWLWSFLSRLITYLLLGALILWILPKAAESARKQMRHRFFRTAGVGLVTIITGIISALLLPVIFVGIGLLIGYLSLGGLNLAWYGVVGGIVFLVTAAFWFALANGSILIFCYMLGDQLLGKTSQENPSRRFTAMLLGVGVFVLVRSAPYVGWILGPVAAILGMGALWLILVRTLRNKRNPKKIENPG